MLKLKLICGNCACIVLFSAQITVIFRLFSCSETKPDANADSMLALINIPDQQLKAAEVFFCSEGQVKGQQGVSKLLIYYIAANSARPKDACTPGDASAILI